MWTRKVRGKVVEYVTVVVVVVLTSIAYQVHQSHSARQTLVKAGCEEVGVPDAFTEVAPGIRVKGKHWLCFKETVPTVMAAR